MILALNGDGFIFTEVTDVASSGIMVQQPVVKAGGTAYIKGGCEQQKRVVGSNGRKMPMMPSARESVPNRI